ncbi:U32 family peptidase [Nanoarchaeota archaeon]
MAVEIMAPAGGWEALRAAIKAGADSVYLGVSELNMRSRGAKNFDVSELGEIVAVCSKADVKTYLTLNTVMYDEDLENAYRICDAAKSAGVSAVIVMDISVIEYARSIGMAVHLSTQMNVSNLAAVRFFSKYCDVIVLARELSLDQIAAICSGVAAEDVRGPSGELVKIEVFVHGALCVSISGKCYMSLAVYNESANRGKCLQNCRRKYLVTDEETGDELSVENGYVMSPRDLCCVGIVDRLIGAGVSVFKIEGRGRKADYVHTVVSVYKEALGAVADGSYEAKVSGFKERLAAVFNRGFWENGYYLGNKMGEWSDVYGSKATTVKEHIGKCLNYYSEKKVGLFLVEAGELSVGDKIVILGNKTGIVECVVESMRVDDKDVSVAKKGDEVTMPVSEVVRANDRLFAVRDNS